jgi:arylsulfatase A-like enzyme
MCNLPSKDPFADLNSRLAGKSRLQRWAGGLLGRVLPSRIDPDRDGPPNLLVLGVDTLRADHLGLYGYGQPTSPQLDRLAARGTIFQDVTAPAPWTLPSFSSALSGVMPGLHGAYLPGEMRNMDNQPPGRLSENTVTLATHLRGLGYRTAAFYSNQFFAFGLAESFDHHGYHNLPAAELLDLARSWIRRHADRPFFCFVLLNDPHEPTTPPLEDLHPFAPRLQASGAPCDAAALRAYARWGDKPYTSLVEHTDLQEPRVRQARETKLALYNAAIHYVDRSIGGMQQTLEEWDLARSTLVTVFSDHGEEFLEHENFSQRWNHDPRGIHGIGHGHSLFQELLHVPWLAWGPGVPAGVRSREAVSLCDFAPTVCDWLGVEPLPVEIPEIGNLGPALVGRSQAGPGPGDEERDRLVLSEALAYGPDLVALRCGRWKLMAHRDGRVLALFDLLSSPEEQKDLAAANPEMVAQLTGLLTSWRQSGLGASGQSGDGNWDDMEDTIRQRLKDLGYSE